MEDDLPGLITLLILFSCVLIHALFAAAEYALLRSNPAKIKAPVRQRRRGTRTALWLLEHLELSLPLTQIGTILTTLLIGYFGVGAVAEFCAGVMGVEVISKEPEFFAIVSLVGGLSIILFVHFVIGELFVKSLALGCPERVLRFVSGPLFIFVQICKPLLFIANSIVSLALRPFGISVTSAIKRLHSFSELSMLVAESNEGEGPDQGEQELIRGVVGFSETVAREVMTPRTDLITVQVDANYDAVLALAVDSGFSRFPVTGEGVDDILGYLIGKDLLPYLANGKADKRNSFRAADIMRKPYFIPGTKPIDDLLNEFKRRKLHIAIVLDEHGGVDGIVTMEDVIEEIVGDIFDESDTQEQSLEVLDSGDILADGGTLVSDLNERFVLGIPEGDYDTIAGFIFTSLGRMPKVGDLVEFRENEIQVNGVLSSGVISESFAQVNGSGIHENTIDTDSVDVSSEFVPAVSVSVEKVDGHRIESVLISPQLPENIESPQDTDASET